MTISFKTRQRYVFGLGACFKSLRTPLPKNVSTNISLKKVVLIFPYLLDSVLLQDSNTTEGAGLLILTLLEKIKNIRMLFWALKGRSDVDNDAALVYESYLDRIARTIDNIGKG